MPKAKKKPKKMPKQEFIRLLSRRLEISQEATSLVIDTVQGVILESLEDYDSVKFGDLVINREKSRGKPYIFLAKVYYHLKGCDTDDKSKSRVQKLKAPAVCSQH